MTKINNQLNSVMLRRRELQPNDFRTRRKNWFVRTFFLLLSSQPWDTVDKKSRPNVTRTTGESLVSRHLNPFTCLCFCATSLKLNLWKTQRPQYNSKVSVRPSLLFRQVKWCFCLAVWKLWRAQINRTAEKWGLQSEAIKYSYVSMHIIHLFCFRWASTGC